MILNAILIYLSLGAVATASAYFGGHHSFTWTFRKYALSETYISVGLAIYVTLSWPALFFIARRSADQPVERAENLPPLMMQNDGLDQGNAWGIGVFETGGAERKVRLARCMDKTHAAVIAALLNELRSLAHPGDGAQPVKTE